MKRCMAMILSAALVAGLCLPAMAVEQPGVQTEVSGAASTDYEQASETEPEENGAAADADENKGEASGETEGVTDAGDQNTETTDGQTEAAVEEENVVSADTATTASTAEVAAEVEPVDGGASQNEVTLRTEGEASPWLADYQYYIDVLDDSTSCVRLEYYNGADTDITVPGTAQVDGVTYPVTSNRAQNVWVSNVTSLTFGDGFVFPENCSYFFDGMNSLESVDMSRADTSRVTDMGGMFYNCTSLQDVNLNNIDVTGVTSVGSMFYNCNSIEEIDLSCFSGTNSVQSVYYTFEYCYNLKRLNLGGWDWSSLYSWDDPFNCCESLEELVTPENVQSEIYLPVIMADESGQCYRELPINQQSMSLHLPEVPEWLEDYSYDINSYNQTVNLSDYKGSASVISLPASVYVEDVEYQITMNYGSPWREGVTSLSFGEGFHWTSGWYYRFFQNMTDLQTLDLRNVDFSDVGNFEEPIMGCTDLQYLYLPANMGFTFELGRVFVDDNNNAYTEIPGDLPYSISLHAASASEWLRGFSYSLSNDTIELNGYNGGLEDLVIHSSAEINGTLYSNIKVTNSAVRSWSIKNLAFENGVIIPESISWWFEYEENIESVDFGDLDGVAISSASGLFVNCVNLREVDLSGLDFSNCASTGSFFDRCNALETIKTPIGVVTDIELPGVFEDGEGNLYTYLPKNLSQSITLTRVETSDWLKAYRFDISGNRIILRESKMGYGPGYDYYDTPAVYTVPGSAQIGTRQYNEIELGKGLWTWSNLQELSFEQGVILPADCDGLFNYCYAETIDLSNVDVSEAENMNGMFTHCRDLTTIVTPKNVTLDAGLPGVFTDENNTIYLNLPKNLSNSITLTKTVAGNWLDEYDFYFSGDKIVLTLYKGQNTDVTVPGSAVFGNTTFNKVEISEGVFVDYRYTGAEEVPRIQHLTFSEGVQFPDDSEELFDGCSSLLSIDLSNVDTSNVTNMKYMFAGLWNLASLDLSGFDTTNVTDMYGMFSGCENLTSLDLSGFETTNVTDMSYMFYGCVSLTSLDLSGFDTSNVTYMKSMFRRCSDLMTLDVSDFETGSVEDIAYMFDGCNSLLELDLSGWDLSSVQNVRSAFSGQTPVIKAPVNVPIEINLRALYNGDDGHIYGYLPLGADRSIILTWLSPSGDPSGNPNPSGDPSGDPQPKIITITSQPQDVEAQDGEQVSFTVEAEGDNLQYQWQVSSTGTSWKNCTSTGYNTATFSFTMQEKFAGRQYRCKITSGSESVYSDAALLGLASSPEIITQPQDVEVAAGETAEFYIEVSGSSIEYQWQMSSNGTTWRNCTGTGYNTDTFSFTMKEKFAGRQYRCIVTVDGETLVSDAATLSLSQVDEIITQPQDVEAADGETVELHIEVIGSNPVYQWQFSTNGTTWRNCTGAGYDTDTFSFTMKEKFAGRQYRCIVTTDNTTLTSDAATLSLEQSDGIIEQPADVAASVGETVSFHVGFRGNAPTYQWKVSSNGTTWKNCTAPGYNTDTFSFTMKENFAGRQYKCVVTCGGVTYTSNAAALSLDESLKITSQPEDVTVAAGATASFHIEAAGENLSYQWQVSTTGTSWKNCSGAGYNTDTFSFTTKSSYSGRKYRCKVSDGTDTLTSDSAELTVTQ